jgi:hypothetical protein
MSFFFYFLGYDSHDVAKDVAAKRRRHAKDEEDLLRYLLKQQEKKPKQIKQLDKESIRAALERNFKGPEIKEVLEVIALPQVVSGKDLIQAYQAKAAKENDKKMRFLMALIVLDEEEENEH